MKPSARLGQSGAITLLVAITLVMLASLASFYSARSVLLDRLASNQQGHATQSRLSAEAALAWSRAELARQYTASQQTSTFWQSAANTPCPANYTGPRWQCSQLSPPAHPGMSPSVSQVVAVRDLLTSPHVAELHASASQTGQKSRGQVRASIFLPTLAPAPTGASTAALVLNGCTSPAAGAAGTAVRVCPLSQSGQSCSGTPVGHAVQSFWLADLDGDGLISATERSQCLALLPEHLPGSGSLMGPTTSAPRSPCVSAAWKSVLGDISPEQLKAWSDAQERNGLHAQSQPPRSIYWVDSAATWTQSLGLADAPVLLVFSAMACGQRCPSLASGVQIFGTVVLQTQCQDEKARGWRAGRIEGQLVVESGLQDLQSGSHIQARVFTKPAYQLAWPAGMDATRVQAVAGSWREGVR
jgi:Tfp pilus assembly protein PilX